MDRAAGIFAYVAPFLLFMLFLPIEGMEALKPHYPLVYTVKISLVALVWLLLRKNYPSPSSRGVGVGIVAGILGLGIWLGFAYLNLERFLPDAIRSERIGYDPFAEISSPGGRWAFLAVRFFGLALVVPLIEEVFWRGFLLRWLIDEDFEQVPIGAYTFGSFAAVTLLFALVHPEILAAIAWGALANGVLYLTKNLWATIAMHMTTNLLLGLYVLQTREWFLW